MSQNTSERLLLPGHEQYSRLKRLSSALKRPLPGMLCPWNFLFGAFTAVWIGVAVGSILEEAGFGGSEKTKKNAAIKNKQTDLRQEEKYLQPFSSQYVFVFGIPRSL